MKPIPFEGCNRVFVAPQGTDDCGDLHVLDTGEALVSCWQLTDEERAAIAAGAPIMLWIWCRGQPPVAVEVP